MSQLYKDVGENNVPPANKIKAPLALTASEMILAGISCVDTEPGLQGSREMGKTKRNKRGKSPGTNRPLPLLVKGFFLSSRNSSLVFFSSIFFAVQGLMRFIRPLQ